MPHIPGLKVIAPYDAASCKGLLKAAIRDPNPVVFLENEVMYGVSFDEPLTNEPYEIGKAKIVKEGKDITIVGFSIGMHYIHQALALLHRHCEGALGEEAIGRSPRFSHDGNLSRHPEPSSRHPERSEGSNNSACIRSFASAQDDKC